MSIRFTHLAGIGAAIALLLSNQQATAQTLGGAASESCCNPCFPTYETGMCGDWEVGVHALYFTPIACPYAYATVFTIVPAGGVQDINGQAQVIPCQAEWGFRLFGNYRNDCFFAGLSYQRFEVTTTRSVVAVAPTLVRIQGGQNAGPGKATAQVGIEYQNVDVRVGKYLQQTCRAALYLYGNARWINLSHRRAARMVATDGGSAGVFDDIQEKSQLEGGALGIGFGGEFDVGCDIGAFIDGNFLGVIGERSIRPIRYRGRLLEVTPSIDAQEFYPSEVCVIPEVNFRIGLNYTYACGCWKLVSEVGYELDYFWHGSVLPDLTSAGVVLDSQSFPLVCEDLGFSGLFFGCRLIF